MGMSWDELEQIRPTEWRLPLPPTCRRCGYNLTGLPESRCPECGTPFTWREVRQRSSRIWGMTLRLRHANQDAQTGLILSLSGWFGIGVTTLIGNEYIVSVVAMMAVLAGLLSVILGSQVLNVRRIPPWAREYVCKPPPNIVLGAVTIVLALSLFLGGFIFVF